ncbi:hypothetical protein EV130_101316 [Rhizobium azibense]|uniref:Uncharacterized protein n=1 Tax=Rhizobium azibense TaxID=1136135 RepID=A0A4R3R7P2_9HYPH|nr:hypothetical protein EV130_101316 [Rhizobium azibense]
MIAELVVCATMVAVDADTVKCLPSGQNIHLLGTVFRSYEFLAH